MPPPKNMIKIFCIRAPPQMFMNSPLAYWSSAFKSMAKAQTLPCNSPICNSEVSTGRGGAYPCLCKNDAYICHAEVFHHCLLVKCLAQICSRRVLHLQMISYIQGNLKGESVVAAILPSRMDASYCTTGFFRS